MRLCTLALLLLVSVGAAAEFTEASLRLAIKDMRSALNDLDKAKAKDFMLKFVDPEQVKKQTASGQLNDDMLEKFVAGGKAAKLRQCLDETLLVTPEVQQDQQSYSFRMPNSSKDTMIFSFQNGQWYLRN